MSATTRATIGLALTSAGLAYGATLALSPVADASPQTFVVCQPSPVAEGDQCDRYTDDHGVLPDILNMPACGAEDGNVNGLPCLWHDDATDTYYYVTSEDYR